jgi:hypothetical protein
MNYEHMTFDEILRVAEPQTEQELTIANDKIEKLVVRAEGLTHTPNRHTLGL